MALARGNVVSRTDFQLPVLQVPFEQLYGQMQQFQLEKDQGDALSAMVPKYLEQDAQDAVKYQSFVNNLRTATVNAFADGNTADAIRTMRSAQGELKKQWQPGGLANALQSRYDQYQLANKAIGDATKDNKSPIYGNYYREMLNNQVGTGTGYDPATGTYKSIAAPQVGSEVILGDEADKFLKGWMADKGVEITKSPDGMWYNKVTREQVSADELRGALNQFYQQPHIQSALGIYGWDRAQRMDVDAARQSYQNQLMGQLDKQDAALNGLLSKAKTGNRAQIIQIQEELKSQGYTLNADGKYGSATESALKDYINSTKQEQAKLRGQIPQQVQGIEAGQFAAQSLKDEISNTYVPKYAYTKRDVDMIANQPAIAAMRIKAQNQAIAGLKTMLFAPTATMITPVTTTPVSVQSIGTQYNASKKAYIEVEQSMLRDLTPQMQSAIRSYNVPAYKSVGAMYNAAEGAVVNGKFNPTKYRELLRQQGVRISDAEIDRQARLLDSPNNRRVLEGLYENLTPAASGMKVAEEMFNSYTSKVITLDKLNWGTIAKESGMGRETGREGSRFIPDLEGVKAAYRNGDPKVMGVVQEHVGRLSRTDQSQLFTGENAVNIVLNEKLKPFEAQLKSQANASLGSIVDYMNMDNKTLAKFGLDKKGNVMRDKDGKRAVNIEQVNIVTTMVNGKSVPMLLIKTSAMDSPLPVPMTQTNQKWRETLINNIAATGINPNNPGQVLDKAVVDAAANLRFDLDQESGTAFDAGIIYQRMNRPGTIGMSFVNTDAGRYQFQTFVVKDSKNSGNYLVTTKSDAEATALRKNPTVDISDIQKSKNSVAVPLINGYEGVNKAIITTKAALYNEEMMRQANAEPFNVTRQPSNLTANPGILMGAFETMFNNNDY